MSTANILDFILDEYTQLSVEPYTGSQTIVTYFDTTVNSVNYRISGYDVSVYADSGRVTEIEEGVSSNQLTFLRDSYYTTETGEDIITGFRLNSATYEGTVYVDIKVIGGYTQAMTDDFVFSNGLKLSESRIASQELISGILSVDGWYTIAESQSGKAFRSYIADFYISYDADYSISCKAGISNSDVIKTKNNTIIEITGRARTGISSGVVGVRIAKSDSVQSSGAKLQVNLLTPINRALIVQMIGNSGSSIVNGWTLVSPTQTDIGLLPDGTTSATFLEAGEEYKSKSGGAVNSSNISFAKLNDDAIALSINWNEIPKQATGLILNYTTLQVIEYTSSLQTYTFDGSESIGSPNITGNEVTVIITKVTAFTNFTNAGKTVRGNTLIIALT